MSVLYTEVSAGPALSSLVACYWTVQGATSGMVGNRVLPDGCMDVILNLGDPTLPRTVPHHGLGAYVVGTMRTAAVIEHTGRVDMFGVRFRPGAAVRFVDARADELTDRFAPLEVFWPDGEELREMLATLPAASSPARGDEEAGSAAAQASVAAQRLRARAALIEQRLLARAPAALQPDPLVAEAIRRIAQDGGLTPIALLSRQLGTSERTLVRRFTEKVGLSPKEASRIARLARARQILRHASSPGLARAAAMAGFTDQAHLTREFTRIAGITPAAWLRERGGGFVQDAGETDR